MFSNRVPVVAIIHTHTLEVALFELADDILHDNNWRLNGRY